MKTLTRLLIYTMLVIIAFLAEVCTKFEQEIEKKERWIVYKGPLTVYNIKDIKSIRDSQLEGMLIFNDAKGLTISNCNIISDPAEWESPFEFKNSKTNRAGNTDQKLRNHDDFDPNTTGLLRQEFDANFHEIRHPVS